MQYMPFGTTARGEEATLFLLKNDNGMAIELTDYGATLLALYVPTRYGNSVDVVLGYDDVQDYERARGTFFGATVGRNANRIGGAAFTLGDKTYALSPNDGGNNLHSGPDFYNTRLWLVTAGADNSITFSLHSPDGDQGHPGALDVDVTYTLTDDNCLCIDYRCVPQQDTIVNLTNHSYFNLNGHDTGSIERHRLWLNADAFTPTDAQLIPTGEILPVDGTPMDFREEKQIGQDIAADFEPLRFGKGYDHNWQLSNGGGFAKVAELTGNLTGLRMEISTDRPGMQIYTANFIENEAGKRGAIYRKRSGICFETQSFPDAIHHENFPSPVCRAGETWQSRTVFRFI